MIKHNLTNLFFTITKHIFKCGQMLDTDPLLTFFRSGTFYIIHPA